MGFAGVSAMSTSAKLGCPKCRSVSAYSIVDGKGARLAWCERCGHIRLISAAELALAGPAEQVAAHSEALLG